MYVFKYKGRQIELVVDSNGDKIIPVGTKIPEWSGSGDEPPEYYYFILRNTDNHIVNYKEQQSLTDVQISRILIGKNIKRSYIFEENNDYSVSKVKKTSNTKNKPDSNEVVDSKPTEKKVTEPKTAKKEVTKPVESKSSEKNTIEKEVIKKEPIKPKPAKDKAKEDTKLENPVSKDTNKESEIKDSSAKSDEQLSKSIDLILNTVKDGSGSMSGGILMPLIDSLDTLNGNLDRLSKMIK